MFASNDAAARSAFVDFSERRPLSAVVVNNLCSNVPVPNCCCCRRVSAIGANKLLRNQLAEKGTFRVLFIHVHHPPPSAPPSLASRRVDNLRLEMRGKRIFKLLHVWLFFSVFLLLFWILRHNLWNFPSQSLQDAYCHPPAVGAPYLQPSYPHAAFQCRLRSRAWLLCKAKRAQNLKCLWDHKSDLCQSGVLCLCFHSLPLRMTHVTIGLHF